MSVTIRLSKTGKRNLPSYRIVVCPTKSKRNGKDLDFIGFYNPSNKPVLMEFDKKKMDEWKKEGAVVSSTVEKIISGKYQYIKYEPRKDRAKAE